MILVYCHVLVRKGPQEIDPPLKMTLERTFYKLHMFALKLWHAYSFQVSSIYVIRVFVTIDKVPS